MIDRPVPIPDAQGKGRSHGSLQVLDGTLDGPAGLAIDVYNQ